MAQYPGCTVQTCACADLSVSVGDPDPHSAPSPLHVAEQPPLAPLSVSPAVFSPTSSLENHRIFSSEHCPSNPDGSDLGSVSWQERDFQPFTLEKLSLRGVWESCQVLSPRYLSTKFWKQLLLNGKFCPTEDFGKVWRQFWFSQLAGEEGWF